VKRVIKGVHIVPMGFAAFLIEGDGLTLNDAGFPRKESAVFGAIRALGRSDAITSDPSFWRVGISLLKHEPSARDGGFSDRICHEVSSKEKGSVVKIATSFSTDRREVVCPSVRRPRFFKGRQVHRYGPRCRTAFALVDLVALQAHQDHRQPGPGMPSCALHDVCVNCVISF